MPDLKSDNSISHSVYPQLDGVFILNKPSGPSSAQCLKIFKKLGQKKVGHAGTLDPMASGVLLVLLGQATKISSYLQAGGQKTYSGVLRLGIETDTWDVQGETLAESPWEHLSVEAVKQELLSWQGVREQEVPPYSAAKHNGQPMYKLARKGLETPKKTKTINISEASISKIDMPYVHFRVSCSSGSYIRSLAHSLGKRLGCGAALFKLVREYSHPFTIDQATDQDELRENPDVLQKKLLPLWHALPDWPRIELSPEEIVKVKNGSPISGSSAMPNSFAILCRNNFPAALAKFTGEGNSGTWTVMRGLWS